MFEPSPFLVANHEFESAPTENLPLPCKLAPGVICRSCDWKPRGNSGSNLIRIISRRSLLLLVFNCGREVDFCLLIFRLHIDVGGEPDG
jgi:hypothetical protein